MWVDGGLCGSIGDPRGRSVSTDLSRRQGGQLLLMLNDRLNHVHTGCVEVDSTGRRSSLFLRCSHENTHISVILLDSRWEEQEGPSPIGRKGHLVLSKVPHPLPGRIILWESSSSLLRLCRVSHHPCSASPRTSSHPSPAHTHTY